MIEYEATLHRVIDGETIECNVKLDEVQTLKRVIRLRGVQTPDIRKTRHTTLSGGLGLQYKYYVAQWFHEREADLLIQFYEKDIVGRWLSDVFSVSDEKSVNDYLKEKYFESEYWKEPKQAEEKAKWFSGEVVTVPQGGELPIFHAWGKNVFCGFRSLQL